MPSEPSNDTEQWLTSAEAARFLSVQPDTLQKWRRHGRGPDYTTALGLRSPRYRRRDLDAFMQDGMVSNTTQAASYHRNQR
ncbi:MAG: helix-turn-helix domain-containing protein [Henriciella sp.]|uniref:helix-turn-helix domain-containing protein n=1 Tax=Henriciella sp. TaxID=1968823 RepID=UPI0032EAC94A